MARHMRAKGSAPFIVYDLNRKAVEQFQAESDASVESASSPAELASRASVIVTVLPESAHDKGAYLGKAGITRSVRHGALCIDSTTIDTPASVDVSSQVIAAGARSVDAPVSGEGNHGRQGCVAGVHVSTFAALYTHQKLKKISSYRLRASDSMELPSEYYVGRFLLTLEAEQSRAEQGQSPDTSGATGSADTACATAGALSGQRIVLRDEDGSTLTRTRLPKSRVVEVGGELDLGIYLIQTESVKGGENSSVLLVMSRAGGVAASPLVRQQASRKRAKALACKGVGVLFFGECTMRQAFMDIAAFKAQPTCSKVALSKGDSVTLELSRRESYAGYARDDTWTISARMGFKTESVFLARS
ncbi:hypothetical protein GGF42_005619, partial [Coemansia sp. RSA 2424]